jgi:Na+/H+ antiporter NhaD/arsenite permease-like protein
VRRHGLPPLPYLLALATAANTGSVATLVGNPQNMLCAQLGGLVYREYALSAIPIALLGLALNHLWLDLCFRRILREHALRPVEHAPPIARRAQLDLLVIALTAVAYTLGADLAWAAASGFVALMLAHRRDTQRLWSHIDFSILLFFAGLFVVVQGLVTSGLPRWFFERFPLSALEDGAGGAWSLTAVFLLGSNLVSNVPFILVVRDAMSALEDPERAWKLLAVASTFAGNLTLLGSVANVIVAESARELGGFGFRQHLKIGLPLGLATTALGALWLLVVEPLIGLA